VHLRQNCYLATVAARRHRCVSGRSHPRQPAEESPDTSRFARHERRPGVGRVAFATLVGTFIIEPCVVFLKPGALCPQRCSEAELRDRTNSAKHGCRRLTETHTTAREQHRKERLTCDQTKFKFSQIAMNARCLFADPLQRSRCTVLLCRSTTHPNQSRPAASKRARAESRVASISRKAVAAASPNGGLPSYTASAFPGSMIYVSCQIPTLPFPRANLL
jgi:hypothetical protein